MAPAKARRIALSVGTWSSEESVLAWKYLKAHVLQPKDGPHWQDTLVVVHVHSKKDRRDPGERWDSAGPIIPDVATATAAYATEIVELEGEPEPMLVDFVNKHKFHLLVIASRGRGPVKKAMMGSTLEYVVHRVACPVLVAKTQVGAGDTYRLRTSASSPLAQIQQAQSGGARSPTSTSPMYARVGSGSGPPLSTPFNRRICIAYDTTANGRYLLKWAAEHVLEADDNVFVVRAVPRKVGPSTSFSDKNNVQTLATETLAHLPHVTGFNLSQGNACKAVLSFVGQEAVDLLVLGLYAVPRAQRKGLAMRGNASALYNRCACSALVVPLLEDALQRAVKPHDLALAAAEEDEMASGPESDLDDEEEEPESKGGPPSIATSSMPRSNTGKFAGIFRRGRMAGSMGTHDAAASSLRGASGTAHDGARPASPRGGAPAWAAALAPGRYVVEVDGAGQLRSAHALVPVGAPASGPEDAGPEGGDAGSAAALAAVLAARDAEVRDLRRRLAALTGCSGVPASEEFGDAKGALGAPRSSDGSGIEVPPGAQCQ